MLKRVFDLVFAITGLVLLSPLFLVIALWVKIDSPGPVFFRQERVGRGGQVFLILKFRTMAVTSEKQVLQLTVQGDPRITRSGALLRKYKLDELPQLINVLLGDMSLVGPRPEVPRYVAEYPIDVKNLVLSMRPGITDRASIEYKDEEEILGRAVDSETTYIQEILPVKLAYYTEYVKSHTLMGDLGLILKTIVAIANSRIRVARAIPELPIKVSDRLEITTGHGLPSVGKPLWRSGAKMRWAQARVVLSSFRQHRRENARGRPLN